MGGFSRHRKHTLRNVVPTLSGQLILPSSWNASVHANSFDILWT
ncbi:hypothetical protein NX868_19225 [Burkholderia thailandensis]|uniref:Transposase n=1 Tax=Burkholderia thailandensis TaxID=57975 RepID=A0AAW9CXL5_BURTH|nr:hypothetical protein [Burkholderia thailandensis]MCS3393368.1 hypothetical protein [Burkholderia thailandensis]MCS6426572.1 hypothetical protein [Burkholderia thailandensis]MCS6454886.1 hypothetical protein [Burkholderia thailandensis]MCS6465788.1 hypothetical protein [Burkholderia thailandensis]MCS6484399.1 hypothetical protein [Burkholderia thailandensis]